MPLAVKLLLLRRDLCETRAKRETGVPCLTPAVSQAAARPCWGGQHPLLSPPRGTERDRPRREASGRGLPLAGMGPSLWDCVPQGSLSLLTFDFPKGNFPQQSPAQLPHPSGAQARPWPLVWCVDADPSQGSCRSPTRRSAATCFVPRIIPTFRARLSGTALSNAPWAAPLPLQPVYRDRGCISHPTRTAASAGSGFTKAPRFSKARNSVLQRFPVAAALCSARAGGFPCALELCPGAFP